MTLTTITTWYLAYQDKTPELPTWPAGSLLMEAEIASPELSQFLFTAVGNHWRWYSRLSWDYGHWQSYLTSGRVRTWVLYCRGTPAGYIELCQHDDNPGETSVELKFFGLLPAFIGQGLGPKLAQAAISLARQWTAGKIWVHTCSADHPAALATYQKAGFVIYHSEQENDTIPANYLEAALCRLYVQSRLQYFAPAEG
jgi:GNAT superfamily N-acetyltransferase